MFRFHDKLKTLENNIFLTLKSALILMCPKRLQTCSNLTLHACASCTHFTKIDEHATFLPTMAAERSSET